MTVLHLISSIVTDGMCIDKFLYWMFVCRCLMCYCFFHCLFVCLLAAFKLF